MRAYQLIAPTGGIKDFSHHVTDEPSFIFEQAFSLESYTIPGDVVIPVINNTGFFDPQIYLPYDMTEHIVQIVDDGIIIYRGIISNIEYVNNFAKITTSSALAIYLQAVVPISGAINFIGGTPAEFALTLFDNQLNIQENFIDRAQFANFIAAEIDQGYSISVIIPDTNTDRKRIVDILSELYVQTGLYIYSADGIIRPGRIGKPPSDNYDYEINTDMIIAGSLTISRPILFQKTKSIVDFFDGTEIIKAAKNMTDYDPIDGLAIINKFKEKILKSNEGTPYLYHSNLISATAAQDAILGFRGYPRYYATISIDIADQINTAILSDIELFNILRLITPEVIFTGIVYKKSIGKANAKLDMISTVDPIFTRLDALKFPVMTNQYAKFSIAIATDFAEYELIINGVVYTGLTASAHQIPNPTQSDARIRLKIATTGIWTDYYNVDYDLNPIDAQDLNEEV